MNWAEPQTFWLTVTNIALGVICLTCIVLVSAAVVREVAKRAKARGTILPEFDAHTMAVPGLGTTMADGGEPVEEKKTK